MSLDFEGDRVIIRVNEPVDYKQRKPKDWADIVCRRGEIIDPGVICCLCQKKTENTCPFDGKPEKLCCDQNFSLIDKPPDEVDRVISQEFERQFGPIVGAQ